MFQIERTIPSDKCYYCGRNKDNLNQLIDPEHIRSEIRESIYNSAKEGDSKPNAGYFLLPSSLDIANYTLVMYTDFNGDHVSQAHDNKFYYDYNFDHNRLLSDAIPIEDEKIIELKIHVPVCGICRKRDALKQGSPA